MKHLKDTIESRIVSTLKMNPNLTWIEASDLTLKSIGVMYALPSRTLSLQQQRSVVAKQRIEPMAED